MGSGPGKPGVADKAAARSVLGKCLDLGITFFDTANCGAAGESERIVASTLTSMVPRDTLVLATHPLNGDSGERGLSRKHLLASVDASLRRMKTDYIDLLVIHAFDPATPLEVPHSRRLRRRAFSARDTLALPGPGPARRPWNNRPGSLALPGCDCSMEETMAALHDAVRSGKVRYLGASTMFAWQFAQMNHVARLNGWTQLVSMQCEYNLLYREEEREMLPFCRHQGIAVTASSVLARGQLSGSGTRTDGHSGVYGDALDREICARVEAIAADHDTTMEAVAIAWVLSRDDICCPIIGAATAKQVASNVGALDFALTEDETAELDALYRPRDVINRAKPMPRYWQEEPSAREASPTVDA